MAEKRSVGQMGVDLVSFTPPVETSGDSADAQHDRAELERILLRAAQQGVLQRSHDGGFHLPGLEHPREAFMREHGSMCECARCTPYQQYHWYCAGCYAGPFDWNFRPPTDGSIILLGGSGRSGKAYHFCTPECGQAYRRRHPHQTLGRPTPEYHAAPGAGMDLDPYAPIVDVSQIPVAGGDR